MNNHTEFTQELMYRCKYCKEYFKTDKHICMKNPDNRNCRTCDNRRSDGDGVSYCIEAEHYESLDELTNCKQRPFRFDVVKVSGGHKRIINCERWEPRTYNYTIKTKEERDESNR